MKLHIPTERNQILAAAALALSVAFGACSHSTSAAHNDGSTSNGTGVGGAVTTGSGGSAGGASGGMGGLGAVGGAAGGIATDGGGGGAPDIGDSVLMLHRNPSHDGVYIQPALTLDAVGKLDVVSGFKATLPDPNDHVFAQPLFVDGGPGGTDLVIVATEANNVYALDGATGHIVWTKNLGAPVPLTKMSCGNLDPYGVTGTPVIDFVSRRVFATAAILPASGTPTYQIFALSLVDGSISMGWPVDVPTVAVSGATTFTTKTQGQRGALALVGGTLYVPFGGLYGDCQPFHGWIVAVAIDAPASVKVWTTSALGGGLWAPGGIASDGTSIFAGTGITFSTTTWGGGDAVLRFGTGAAFGAPEDSFAPGDWHTALDPSDLGSGAAPVLFSLAGSTPSALALIFQKDGKAYLLDRAHLGGVGAALGATGAGPTQYASAYVATNEIITVPAVYTTATATYVAFRTNGRGCPGGTMATAKITPGAPPTIAIAWCAGDGFGSPIVTTSDGTHDAIVWLPAAESSNHLLALDGDSGAPITFPGSATTITGMRRFNSAIAAKGKIYVASDGAVVAFGLP